METQNQAKRKTPDTPTQTTQPTKKIYAQTVASAAPVRYNVPAPEPSHPNINLDSLAPVVDIRHAHNQAYEQLLSTPAILREKYHHEMGKSYQEAMAQLDKNKSQAPKYVFPHMAPTKAQTQQNNTAPTKKIVRKAGGEVWEDPTLAEWPDNDHRIFVGNLGNEVNDETLARAFGRYPSLQRARVIRDKRSGKTKGFGFVSFTDPSDFVKALKEVNGKYIGNRPCKLSKSTWAERNAELDDETSKVLYQTKRRK